jgi:mRNA interferase RelE/StbE
MVSYKIEWKRSAIRELRGLEKDIIGKVLAAVEKLAINPYPSGSKKLRGSTYTYRLRIGTYRLVYQVDSSVFKIEIIRIGHRQGVYK